MNQQSLLEHIPAGIAFLVNDFWATLLWLSRNLLWITILSTTFPVLFYGYSLVVVFSSAFFFSQKKKQKTLHKRNCRKFPLLVPQECVHSVGYLLVIAAYGCFKGAADRPQLATLRASN